jgi:thymidylate synthase
MIAHVCGLQPGDFVHTLASAHIYLNHLNQVQTLLGRQPRKPPTLWLNPEVKSLFDFRYEDIRLDGYDPHPAIAAPIAV